VVLYTICLAYPRVHFFGGGSDTTIQPEEGGGHPFGYFPQDAIEQQGDEDAIRLVREYDPSSEFVTTLLKHQDRVSSYRLRAIPKES
jgi:hypothetical protein